MMVVVVGLIIAWWLNTTTNAAFFPQTQTYSVPGQPSISADFINRVLDHYHSPAAGKGQALYDYGVKYGIDPVYVWDNWRRQDNPFPRQYPLHAGISGLSWIPHVSHLGRRV